METTAKPSEILYAIGRSRPHRCGVEGCRWWMFPLLNSCGPKATHYIVPFLFLELTETIPT